jgi:uncharacterized protein DUF551
MKWQPIETAPKVGNGGPQIMLYSRAQGYCVGTWRGGWGWVSIPGTYGKKPTHWMPLPEPPNG